MSAIEPELVDFNVTDILHVVERLPDTTWHVTRSAQGQGGSGINSVPVFTEKAPEFISNNNYYILGYALTGSALYTINGKHYTIRKNDLVFIKQGSSHMARTLNPCDPWHFYSLSFFIQFNNEATRRFVHSLPDVISGYTIKLLPVLMDEANKVWISKRTGFLIQCRGLIMQALYLLICSYAYSKNNISQYEDVERVNSVLQGNNLRSIPNDLTGSDGQFELFTLSRAVSHHNRDVPGQLPYPDENQQGAKPVVDRAIQCLTNFHAAWIQRHILLQPHVQEIYRRISLRISHELTGRRPDQPIGSVSRAYAGCTHNRRQACAHRLLSARSACGLDRPAGGSQTAALASGNNLLPEKVASFRAVSALAKLDRLIQSMGSPQYLADRPSSSRGQRRSKHIQAIPCNKQLDIASLQIFPCGFLPGTRHNHPHHRAIKAGVIVSVLSLPTMMGFCVNRFDTLSHQNS